MTQSHPVPVSAPPSSPSGAGRDLARLAQAMDHLIASAEPAVVFSSLARLCVPAFSDRCIIDLAEDDNAAYRIDYPAGGPTPAVPSADPACLRTRVTATPGTAQQPYSAEVSHSWDHYTPSDADAAIAQLLVTRAVTAIDRERLDDIARHALDQAANLQIALTSNRQIGTALGILMANHKITDTAAFTLLRTTSQRTHRKLRDIADDVVQAGCLDPRIS
ncbi:MAG: ANTAR domain-containing protein [Jatrophihabitans sp.]